MSIKPTTCSRQLDVLFPRRPYTCQSCRIAVPPRKRPRIERYASTSTTAINGTRPIPPQNRPLYEALTDVKSTASAYVNLSRLQLALQGLESIRPTTRIAILGLNVQDTARSIARLLLADALEDEHDWEKQILEQQGTQGILIRYGQPQSSNIPQRSTLPILQIPSSILERLNVELLVASINAENINGTGVPAEAFLAPAVGVPTAFDGRQVTVNQPVHETLLVANGFEELVKAIELFSATKFRSEEDKRAVVLAANLPGNNTASNGQVIVSDVARAVKGLKAIRESTSKAMTYEHEWVASGLPQLSEWLLQHSSSATSSQKLATPVSNLISSLLSATSTSLDQSSAAAQTFVLPGIDTATHTKIETAIEDFSRAAHQELQSGLASAWSSRNWTKLSWYKLFWRVDDVGLIISDLVTNTWLPKTERAVYEISGRLTQIGIDPVTETSEPQPTEHRTAFEPGPEPETAQATILNPTPPLLATATTAPSNEIILPTPTQPVITTSSAGQPLLNLQPTPRPTPITSTISTTRTTYLSNQITQLTTTAQQLVLRTLSISGLSGGLSALTYASTIAPTIYEAGTIFAVGTVFALYRMQTGWQLATRNLEKGLFEEGRSVVRSVVGRMRELVEMKRGEVSGGDVVEMRMIESARGAVERAKGALEELKRDSVVVSKEGSRR